MVAELQEMQENQGFSENRIDKLEFIDNSTYFTPCISPYLSFRLSIPLITERKHD